MASTNKCQGGILIDSQLWPKNFWPW